MKIKIHKTRTLNESTLEEGLPAAVVPAITRLAPMLRKWGPKIAKAVPALGGGDDEEKAQAIADAISDKVEVNPLDVESETLTQHTQMLDDIRQILQGINASIAKLPQDPGAIAATGDDAGAVDVVRSSAPKEGPVGKAVSKIKGALKSARGKFKPPFKVVKEKKINNNLKSLL